jgi:hypothetical protein
VLRFPLLPTFVSGILRSARCLGELISASPRVSAVKNAFLATSPMWISVPLCAVKIDAVVVNKERMKAGK